MCCHLMCHLKCHNLIRHSSNSPSSHVQAADAGSGVVRGKINRDVLIAALGTDLLASINAVDSRRAQKPGRDRSFSISSNGSETDKDGEEKLDTGDDEDGDREDSLAALVGSDSTPGKLQVKMMTLMMFWRAFLFPGALATKSSQQTSLSSHLV